jgi:7-keto-8-aminopelargonate synthetase-like enzyme
MIDGFRKLGFNTGETETAVVPLIIGDDEKTFQFWKYLFEQGVYVNPVVSPAVPPDSALIRTSYMAIHEDQELDWFLEVAQKGAKEIGIIK